jgi:hypothetical protein
VGSSTAYFSIYAEGQQHMSNGDGVIERKRQNSLDLLKA